GSGVCLYVVTNAHLIEGNCTIVRLNRQDGSIDILPLTYDDWRLHEAGDDIAAAPVNLTAEHRHNWIFTSEFVTPKTLRDFNIGPGDEVFMVGRFSEHQGVDRNAPVVRFGNISMVEPAPIDQGERGRRQESFLVEMRSQSGFSGSPVIVYFGTTGVRQQVPVGGLSLASLVINKGWLVGIDWGHLPRKSSVFDADGTQTEYSVRESSAMACVVPAWKLLELLEGDDLVRRRQRGESPH